ncbi:MAG: peptidylprolyl isomerase [Terriglobia bacterium]
MIQIRWGRGRWFTGGLLMAGLLMGGVYGRTLGGQAPARPTASAAAAAQTPSAGKIVLKVGDESVTQGDVEATLNSLTPQAQRSLSLQGRKPLGDQIAMMLILSQQALSHHLESTAGFQHALAMARRQILAQAAYQEVARQSVVTPEEISGYLASHQSEFEETQIEQVVVRKKPEGAKEGTPGFSAEDAKTRVEEIRKALSSGDDPKKVAEKYQVPNLIRVDAEPVVVHRGAMRADMEKAASELKDGQVSEVFDFPQMLVFFKLVSHKVGELKNVSSQIEDTLRQQKITSALDALKKNAKIWMDDAYFAVPNQPGSQGAIKPALQPGGPAAPK